MKFVFDLDGTICFKGRPLSKEMVQAIDTLMKKGHEVLLASARPIRDLLPILPAHMHQLPMVGGNGAFVAKDGHILSTTHFDENTCDAICHLVKKYDASYLIDSKWDYAYTGNDEHPIRRNLDPERRAKNMELHKLNEIVKVVILHSKDEQQLMEELQELPVVIYVHGNEGILDISPHGIDKWKGLQQLDVESQQFIAFGNDANDVSMFRHAQRSVCVGEHPDLLQVATDQVINNEGQVIQKVMDIVEEYEKLPF